MGKNHSNKSFYSGCNIAALYLTWMGSVSCVSNNLRALHSADTAFWHGRNCKADGPTVWTQSDLNCRTKDRYCGRITRRIGSGGREYRRTHALTFQITRHLQMSCIRTRYCYCSSKTTACRRIARCRRRVGTDPCWGRGRGRSQGYGNNKDRCHEKEDEYCLHVCWSSRQERMRNDSIYTMPNSTSNTVFFTLPLQKWKENERNWVSFLFTSLWIVEVKWRAERCDFPERTTTFLFSHSRS